MHYDDAFEDCFASRSLYDDGDAFSRKSHDQSDILMSSSLLSVQLFVLIFRYSFILDCI